MQFHSRTVLPLQYLVDILNPSVVVLRPKRSAFVDGLGVDLKVKTDIQIPLWIREAVSKICRKYPFRLLGQYFYTFVARHCAKSLSTLPYSESLFLRGKEPSASNPGISDLDFWLFISESELINTSSLRNLRSHFRKLRSCFLLPGKLEVTSTDAWELARRIAPASFLQDLPLRRFTESGWHKESISPARPIRLLSRFNKSTFDYFNALPHFAQAATKRNYYYHSTIFSKYLHKSVDYARADELLTHSPKSLPALLAEAFCTLHELAESALKERTAAPSVNFTIRHSVASDERKENQADNLQHTLKSRGFDVLSVTPNILIWDCYERDKTEDLFTTLFEFFLSSEGKIANQEFSSSPVQFLSSRMLECLWNSAQAGPLLEDLPKLPNSLRLNQDSRNPIESNIFLYLLDRLVTRANHNLGVVVSYPSTTFIKPLLYQCLELLVVTTRQVTNDLNLLCELSSNKVPATVKCFRRLLAKDYYTTEKDWIAAFSEVHAESMAILRDYVGSELS